MRERFGSPSAMVALAALTLATFAYVTTETLPIGLLPLIAHDLGRTESAVGLLVTAYGLVVVLASIPLTRFTTRVDRRRLLGVLLGIFVGATVVSALATTYWMLLAARMVTALSQALFWAVVTPAAAGLFRPAVRARAIAILFAGGSIASLAGVPAGTWLGQQTNWRVAFLVLSGIGLAVLVAVVMLLPSAAEGGSDADVGATPDRGRYWAIVVYAALTVTGAFASFTYLSPFLTQVTGFGPGAVGPVLFLRGVAGLVGVLVVGYLIGWNGWVTMTGLIGVQTLALTAQWVFASDRIVTVVAVCVSGCVLSAIAAGLGARVLEVAPGRTDIAGAGTSTAFNVGITAGAFVGSLLLSAHGARGVALAGAAFTLLAFVVVLAEPRLSTARPAEDADDQPPPLSISPR